MTLGFFRAMLTLTLFLAFLGLWAWAWSKRRQGDFEAAARLPLEDHLPAASADSSTLGERT